MGIIAAALRFALTNHPSHLAGVISATQAVAREHEERHHNAADNITVAASDAYASALNRAGEHREAAVAAGRIASKLASVA